VLGGDLYSRDAPYKSTMSKITEYFKNIKGELKHVNWPTRKQATTYTILVITVSILVAYFFGLFDFIFSEGLEKIIGF